MTDGAHTVPFGAGSRRDAGAPPTHLRVEHLDEPLGIDVRRPRLSWRLPVGTSEQRAYELRAGGWSSGRVESSESTLVPYGGPALASGQRVSWQVRVWTDAGPSEWSEPGWWEMGLLEPSDWVAQWIEPLERDEIRIETLHPAYLLRGSFTLEAQPASARLYVTAHGVYEFLINGERVGDMELTPGFTSYSSNLQVQTFDVGHLIVPGANVLAAVVSDGWFRGQTGGLRANRVYGDSVALLAQLHVTGENGSLTCVGTGPEWLASTGSILAADLMQGESVDLRRDRPGWSTATAALDGWAPVVTRAYDLRRLRSSPSPPVRRVQELAPVAVTRPSPDRQVVDLGQNINGWVRLTSLGPAGTTLSLTHGEVLDAGGDVTLENVAVSFDDQPALAAMAWDTSNTTLPFQVDRVTAAGAPGERFEPRHTTHGFRYVRIEGHPGEIGPDDLRGVVVHTDLRRTGWFACSDERINRLHEAVVWTFRGNACDIPTDCPTRERSAYGGDWAHFVPMASFLYDVAGFATKWLRDLAVEQRADGCVGYMAPDTHAPEHKEVTPPGSSGWGDAAVIVPWEVYRAYGDRRLLAEQWPSMVAWVEYAARCAREARHPSRVAARPTPAPHETFIWDTGFHYGEWLEPGRTMDLEELRVADHGDLATAYLHLSSHLLAQVAGILGRDQAEERYRGLAAAVRAAWQAEFIRADGTLVRDTQPTYVRALAFGLAPEELRPVLARRLVELVRDAGTHPGTGVLATPYLLPVLADTGHLDVAYDLLLQDTEPSWLTMVDRGATTLWECWNSIDERGLVRGPRAAHSLNHFWIGAVVAFLHRYVAGIRMVDDVPAYRRFRIAPAPDDRITWADAALETPYGRIKSSWRVDDGQLTLEVTVPPGTSAEICLPDGQRLDARPGEAIFTCAIT